MEEIPTIYIGKKNMSYYLNVCLRLLEKGKNHFIIEGLGDNVKKAVDVANFLRIFYRKGGIKITNIDIDLIEKDIVRGLPRKVSRIRIEIEREEGVK